VDADDLRGALAPFDGDVKVMVRTSETEGGTWPIRSIDEVIDHDGQPLAVISI
jgi:hypothetical protein